VTDQSKLLLDEMLSGEVAAQLRAKGHDVEAVVEDPALLATPDEELLTHAASVGRTLVTTNVGDFAAIYASWTSRGRRHAGLIYIANRSFPQDRSFAGAIVTALGELIVSGRPRDGVAEIYLGRARP
jgi:predicted nuclease of predicted toxin-antitoxin system